MVHDRQRTDQIMIGMDKSVSSEQWQAPALKTYSLIFDIDIDNDIR